MPRGGSKRGEHRGNAKKRNDTPNAIMKAAVKMVRKPGPGKKGRVGANVATIENDVRTAQVIHGRKSAYDLTPKEIMLENMHRFQQTAYEFVAMRETLLASESPSEARTRVIRETELEEERNRRMASDEAYKVAGYIHPRYAAVAVTNVDAGSQNIVQIMLEEIDRRNREHPMVIEHIPAKKTA